MEPTKKINKLSKLPWFPICLIGLVIIFFSIRLVIAYDSAHYLGYVDIFKGNLPASNWNIVRGPIFPAIIFLFDTFFGKTGTGVLVSTIIYAKSTFAKIPAPSSLAKKSKRLQKNA